MTLTPGGTSASLAVPVQAVPADLENRSYAVTPRCSAPISTLPDDPSVLLCWDAGAYIIDGRAPNSSNYPVAGTVLRLRYPGILELPSTVRAAGADDDSFRCACAIGLV